jgi:hypothetical protein
MNNFKGKPPGIPSSSGSRNFEKGQSTPEVAKRFHQFLVSNLEFCKHLDDKNPGQKGSPDQVRTHVFGGVGSVIIR